NKTGVGYPRVRYEVGFQWYDAAGKPVGERHWLPVPEVERGGVAILDTQYRIDLTYRRSGGNYNRRLLDFILQRPNTAEELRVTVDDGDRVSEADERNNVAALRFALPDLSITGAKWTPSYQVEIRYRNVNAAAIADPFRIGFTWVDDAGAELAATRWVNVVEPVVGSEAILGSRGTDVSYLTERGRQASDRLDWYLERRPARATSIRAVLDDAQTVTEVSERNNMVLLRAPLPDLVVRDAKLDGDRLTFTYGNAGDGYIRDIASRVLFQWVGATGKPVGDPRWSNFAQMDPKQVFTVNGDRFDVEYAVPGTRRMTTQRLSSYVRERPQDAAQLRIVIDDEDRILEASEQNNTATLTPPALKPDLALREVSFAAGRLTFAAVNLDVGIAKGPIPFWFEWINADGERELGPFWYDAPQDLPPVRALKVDSANVRVWGVALRGSGQIEEHAASAILASPPAGVVALKVWVDGPNRIAESNESNNSATLAVPLPDLTVTDLTFINGIIKWKEKNLGDTAQGDFSYNTQMAWLDAKGAVLSERSVQTATFTIKAGSSMPYDFSKDAGTGAAAFLIPPAGSSRLRIAADVKNTVTEKEEGNNTLEIAVPLPDLTVTDLTFINGIIKWKEKNLGDTAQGDFSYHSKVEWLDASGKTLKDWTIQSATVKLSSGAVDPQELSTRFG
ncbi:hypothetical protein HY635_03180, partial [Candidatus Uhrbacteria bacterium]|nr:hypothetical protein [Candidatus Uhrbacteria bacterium]